MLLDSAECRLIAGDRLRYNRLDRPQFTNAEVKTTAAECYRLDGADETTRGPDGNSESNPLSSARRFSAGLCFSIAAIAFLL